MAFVLENQVLYLFADFRSCSTTSRDSCSITRGSLLPCITSIGQRDVVQIVARRALDQEIAILVGVAHAMAK